MCFDSRVAYFVFFFIFFFKQKTAYEMRISDWSSDVCSSDLLPAGVDGGLASARADRSMATAVAQDDGGSTPGRWCRHPGSNWGPTAYKAVALPTELCRQFAREWIAARCRRPGTPRAGILARGGRGRGRPGRAVDGVDAPEIGRAHVR